MPTPTDKLPSYEDIVSSELRDRLAIDPENLEQEFCSCAPNIAYIGALRARAIDEHLVAKAGAKRARATAYMKHREKLQNAHGAGRGGATEAMITAAVDLDETVQEAEDQEISAEVSREELRTMLDAALAKRDSLIQVGSTRRAEMQLDPSIREAHREAGRKLLEGK